MKKSRLLIWRILLPTLLALVLTTVIVSVEKVSPIPTITQTDSMPTVYLDPPTISGTVGQNFTVNIMIQDADEISTWGSGMIFNPALLNCTGFYQGEFFSSIGDTSWYKGTINNVAGVIEQYGCTFMGKLNASGDGRLAYATFKVKASGICDLHLRDVSVVKIVNYVAVEVETRILDVYTAVVETTPHIVVIASNSTGKTGTHHSGLYDHYFNKTIKELGFKVSSPKPGFCNVTIPETLLNVTNLDDWVVIIDGGMLSTGDRTVTYNGTHYSIYFTYSICIHRIQITTRVSSTISIALSSASITLGSDVIISGNITANDPINPQRPNATVTIQSRPIGAINWTTVDTVETDSNSSYTYTWTPGTGGIHEVMTSWEGDGDTVGDESDVLALIVIYVFEPEGVYIETNSTVSEFNSISAFNFSQPLKQISFNVTSPYGTIGYSNVTIPKTLLPPPVPPIGWKVVINGTLLSAEEIIITENATHTSVYFTYSKGVNTVQITTRMSSTLSMTLSSDSIDLGSSVTISGNVTAEDLTVRPNVNVTIQSRLKGAIDWTTLDTVETDSSGIYSHDWIPDTAKVYEVVTSWEGDEETLGDKSDVRTLTVMQNSTISIALSSANITFGSSVTISGSIDPLKPNMPVYIQYKLTGETSWHTAPGSSRTDQDSSYTFEWEPEEPGAYEVKALWVGDETTHGATSSVLTLAAKWTGIISIALSSTEITQRKSITISGNVTADDPDDSVREDVDVTILYKMEDDMDWTALAAVKTDSNGIYTYDWEPGETGTYEVKASWPGDDTTFGNETSVQTLEVKEAAAFPLEIVAAVVVAVIVIAAIAIYFIKFRKSS